MAASNDTGTSPAAADRNLLFGILALQMDFIQRDALIAGMHGWALEKNKPLGDILVRAGGLMPQHRALLDQLVEAHLGLHANDVNKSLAAIDVAGSVRQDLKQIADAEIQQSLASVGGIAPDTPKDPAATVAYESVGESTSAGLRFLILRPHARGGLGEVFVARDQELNREVALKQIQEQHADNNPSQARFIREAEITGALEHPGIVPVYGLGRYPDGRPFYAMRFIRGESLQAAIKRYHASKGQPGGGQQVAFRELLGQFIDVCNAMAYAHSRGVLHRDIKPENVMLGKYGETLVVDWGLAKIGQRSEEGNGAIAGEEFLLPPSASGAGPTIAGSALGTPAYMSPEQAAGKLDLLGPASDVYGLGATLYALLTGHPPYQDGSAGDTLQRVLKGDFTRPRQLDSSVPPALEAICLKAMALRQEDRYSSAQALADDIQHWLADEPVSAWPEPWTVRSRRWIARHRTLVAGAAASLLVALVALGAGLVLLTAANQRERDLRAQAQSNEEKALASAAAEKKARQEAVAAAVAEKHARETAQQSEAETKAVLRFVGTKVFAAARPKGQEGGLGREVTLRRALEASLPSVGTSFQAQPLIEARLRHTLGTSFEYLGEAELARQQFQRALDLRKAKLGPDHPETLLSMNNLAVSYSALGRQAEALKLREETLKLQKAKLGPDDPYTLQSMNNLAGSYYFQGRHAEALRLFEETLALRKAKLGPDDPDTLQSMGNLAASYSALGRHAEALKLSEETLKLQKAKLGLEHPVTLICMDNLAVACRDLGRMNEAIDLHEKAVHLMKAKLGLDHPYTLDSMNEFATTYQCAGRWADAIRLHEETLKIRKAKFGPEHPQTLQTIHGLAFDHEEAGDLAKAESLFRELVPARRRALGPDHPDTAATLTALGLTLLRQQKPTEAEPFLREALTIQEKKLPNLWPRFHTMSLLGSSLLGQKKYAEAEPLLLASYQGLKERESTIPVYDRTRVADAVARLVLLYDAWGKNDKADEWRKKQSASKEASNPGSK
jgi:tetratricopeptide (TPR) repeat protein/tRNA A-37 threonylcarbamoyl transferase component Bud32